MDNLVTTKKLQLKQEHGIVVSKQPPGLKLSQPYIIMTGQGGSTTFHWCPCFIIEPLHYR